MADNAGGNNGVLYLIIGALGVAVVGGGFYLLSGGIPSQKQGNSVDLPAKPVQPTTQAPAPQPAAASDTERVALAASIDRTIAAGDFANADRLLADAMRRYAGNPTWQPLQQNLAKARADRESQLRQTEARRLIAEARRFAEVGDFTHAEQMLQEADKQAPGFMETAQARKEFASIQTERDQRYRERYQYSAAIDQAITSEHFWEAERLLGAYAQRFNQDDEYRARSNRLAQLREAATWQARVNESRAYIAKARQAMDRGEFAEAERDLVLADRSAPGFPEVNQARADLSRRRIAAEKQQDDIRLILAAIDSAFQRKQYDDADYAIEEGRRRYGAYAGWTDLQSRSASARRGDDRQANELRAQNARALDLVAAARRSTTRGDFAAADKSLNEAHALSANMPEVAIARAEFERAKADRARQDAEIRAIAASVDAALARKQYADAERLIADGTKLYPAYTGWAELSRRLAEERRAMPSQTGNAPMPTQPAPQKAAGPATPLPAAANAPAAPAAIPPAAAATPPVVPPAAPAPSTANTPPAGVQLRRLVISAHEAIRRADFTTAEKAVIEAEKIDAKAATVVEVRAELKLAIDKTRLPPTPAASPQQPGPAVAAPAASNTGTAPAASPALPQLVAAARDAIRRSDFTAAEKAVAEAEKLDAKAAPVVETRAELKAAIDKSKTPTPAIAPPQPPANAPPAAPAPAMSPSNNRAEPSPATQLPALSPTPNTASVPPAIAQLQQIIAAARDAIKRLDLVAAEKAVLEAEKLDAKATTTLGIRAELKTAQDKSKEKIPQLVTAARDAIKRSDLAAAEKAVAEAEKLDAKATSVVDVRAELKAAEDKPKEKTPPIPANQPPANRN